MVDSDDMSDDEEFCIAFSVQLIRHTPAVPKMGKQPEIKSKWDVHSKELAFTCLSENYVAFMKSDALDVEKESEYKELVSKINKHRYRKVNIIIDINDVKKRCPIDPDVAVENNIVQDHNPAAMPQEATSLEIALAQFRSMLEKNYGNDSAPGHYVYICEDNYKLTLTPFMMHQWALALNEGQATINTPPTIAAFDHVNRGKSLLPACCTKIESSTPAPDSQMAMFMQLMTTVVGTLIPKSTPKCKRSLDSSPISSPIVLASNDLHNYLIYTRDHLGV